MNFRTEFQIQPSANKIGYNSEIFMAGSCFSENIGNLLSERLFRVASNPFGIVYNPVSIASSIERLVCGNIFSENELSENNGKWFSFEHHGRFSSFSKTNCLENINSEFSKAAGKIKKASFLFITLGTSIVYSYKKTGKIVANCHKLPSSEFERKFLTSIQIEKEFEKAFGSLFAINPAIQVVFTVSPVRHWSEGATDNQLSKAILIAAVHNLRNKIQNINYFPAYELMMDDLRDYRFYADDLLHPNQAAIAYIWEKFKETYLNEDAKTISIIVEDLLKARNHKVFYPGSEEHAKFLSKNNRIVRDLKRKLPDIDLTDFENYFGS